ncbi:MAG: TetR/AcrR family transcriptional regulator C-terminal domain-containing protein [Candidatus Saccharibacteria bacterium]
MNARFDAKQAQLASKSADVQQRIIDAALELLKQDGLANISLRKLAGMVDMQAPALYWYFKSKEDLVDYMAEEILRKEFHDLQPRQAEESWQDWLTGVMIRLRKAMLAYPDGARTVAGAHLYPAVTLAQLSEITLQSLENAGVDLEIARNIMMTTTNYTFGFVIEEQAAPTATSEEIAEFLEPYPTMVRALAHIDFSRDTADESFRTGLGYIISGSTSK